MCRHEKCLRVLARRLCRNDDTAGDLVQETFRRAFESYMSEAVTRALLCRILHNLFIDQCRRERVRDTVAFDEEHMAVPAASIEQPSKPWEEITAEDHLRALETLKPDFREAYRSVVLDECDPDQLARTLGIKPGTLRTRIHRARQQLRDVLLSIVSRRKETV